jgi:hypothetical protein
MSFTFCTSGAIVYKAGLNVNANASTSGAILSQFSDEAEADICTATRTDFIANYANVPTNFKPTLADAAACLAAISLIAYDMSGYSGRGEAEDLINVLYDRSNYCISILKNIKMPDKNF